MKTLIGYQSRTLWRVKLLPNDEDFLIYEDFCKGHSYDQLADMYNTSLNAIYRAIQRVTGVGMRRNNV